jgi:glycosyltransferase involved in cell wall biosynthesis
MSQPHVLFLASWYPSTDAPTRGIFFRELAEALQRANVRIGVLALQRSRWILLRPVMALAGRPSMTTHGGFAEYQIHFWHRLMRLGILKPLLWHQIRRGYLAYTAQHGAPDLIHAQSARYGGYWAARLSEEFAIPYILTEHSSAYGQNLVAAWEEPFVRQALAGARHITVVSPTLGQLLAARYPDVTSDWTTIPNLVTSIFIPPPEPRAAATPFRFLHVGTLKKVKGQDILLAAFAERFKNKPVTLQVGGSGPQKEALQHLAERLGVSAQVSFTGELDRQAVVAAMQQADAFVLASHMETFGVVVIEALACGLPVVATACGGPDLLVNARNGILVPPGDVTALAEAMSQIVARYQDYNRAQISQACHALYGQEAITARWREIYRAFGHG